MKTNKKKDILIYGKNTIKELLKDNKQVIVEFYVDFNKKFSDEFLQNLKKKAKRENILIKSVDQRFFDQNFGLDVNTQGVGARLNNFVFEDFENFLKKSLKKEKELVLVLDGIEDTHNFGAIIRTAAAVGVSAIFVKKHSQASINGTVFKTSAGTIFKVDIIEVVNLSDALNKLKKNNFWTYVLDMSENENDNLFKQDFDKKTVLILGSEGKGVSEKILKNSDFVVSIPMKNNVESLNVSVSGAIVMYKWLEKFGLE